MPPSSISTTHGGGWLTVTDVPLSQANELLGASYHLYYHAGWNDTILRTDGYALPAALHVHVKTIVPTTAFTPTRLLQQTPSHSSSEAAVLNATSGEPLNMLSHRQEKLIHPSVLLELYEFNTYVPPVAENSRLGIVGYDDEFPNLRDQAAFMLANRSINRGETVTWETINRNVVKGFPSHRANMFAQFAAAMTYPIPITFYRGTGKRLAASRNAYVNPNDDDAIHQWLKYAAGQDNNPHTIGLISDGIREMSLPKEYLGAVCDLFEMLGARGTTILVPSGDNGVGSLLSRKFTVQFPASCTCGFCSLLASCTQPHVQVSHRTELISQVPMSLVSAVRTGYPKKSRAISPGAASRITSRLCLTR